MERYTRVKLVACVLTIALIFIVLVFVFVVLPFNSDNNSCEVPDPPADIFFTHYGDGNVKISWNPYCVANCDANCSITYYFLFRYQGVEWNFHTADNFVMLGSLYECLVLVAHLWTMNDQGQTSSYYTEAEFDLTPPNQQITVITAAEWGDALSLTWHKPENLTQCHVTYHVAYSSELGDHNTDIEDPLHLAIPFEKFCFRLSFQISVFVNSEFNSITSYEYSTKADIRQYTIRISSEDPEEFIFTWDSHFKEELCSLQYKVTYRTMTDDPVIVTTTIPEARFHFVYCQAAWISMDVLISNGDIAETTIGSLGATLAPRNITDINAIDIDMVTSKDVMIITWEYSQLADDCYVRYDVNITTDFGTFTDVEVVPPIEFSKDQHCVFLKLQFVVIVLGISSIDAFTVNYDIAPDPVENIIVSRTTDTHLVASWDAHPKEKLCPLLYRIVRIVNGEELVPVETELNSYTFEFTYCVDTQLKITAFIGDHESEFVSIDATQYPTEVDVVTGVEFTEGIISWNAPPLLVACPLTYVLKIVKDNGDAAEFIVKETKFDNIYYCILFNVTVRADYNEDVYSAFTDSYTFIEELPRNTAITDIQFTNTDEGLSVTWTKPVGSDACVIIYHALAIGELDAFNSILNTEHFNVPYDLYCFTVHIIIFTIYKGETSSIKNSIYEEKEIIEQLHFTSHPDNQQELIISWNNHYKSELCKLDYHLVYSSIGIDDQSFNITEPEAKFYFEYCLDANLTIQVYGLERSITGPRYTFDASHKPTAIVLTIQEIYVEIMPNNMMAVSWVPSIYPTHCNILYTASAENPTTSEKSNCTGITECQIGLSDFCPVTEVVIRASSVNEGVINGSPAIKRYTC